MKAGKTSYHTAESTTGSGGVAPTTSLSSTKRSAASR